MVYNPMKTIVILSALFMGACAWQAAAQDSRGVSGTAPGGSGGRVALVMGNAAYPSGPLRNAVNDATDMAAALREVGFDVTLKTDAGLRVMEEAIDAFGTSVPKGGTAIFYYAGHGMQVSGNNYLIPVDAVMKAEKDARYEAVDADRVLVRMETAQAGVSVMILDACRNNPFARSFRSSTPGLAPMQATVGSLIVYATAPGSVAEDGADRNGLFTGALLKRIRTPGMAFRDVLDQARAEVVSATERRQVPWDSSSLTGRFYLVSPDSTTAPKPTVASAPPPPPPAAMAMTGHLQVNVTAPDTEVKVGGRSVGTASPGKPLNVENLSVGPVEVQVSAEGYEPESKTIQIARSEWTQEVFDLVRKMLGQEGPQPGDVDVVDLGGGVKLELVYVPGGTFQMGSSLSPEETARRYGGEAKNFTDEHPQHEVTISRGFWMGKYEVTNEQWRSFADAGSYKSDAEKAGKAWVYNLDGGKWEEQSGASWRKPGWTLDNRNPVVCLSWNDAQAYCTWLSGKTQAAYRLPSEAEWEYACRGGTQTPFPWGADADAGKGWLNGADTHALPNGKHWSTKFNFDDGYWSVSPVGTYRANSFGLHDMQGNVREWCGDWYGESSYGQTTKTDPQGPGTGEYRVLRGGSWDYNPRLCRSAYRGGFYPTGAIDDIGFRVVRSSPR